MPAPTSADVAVWLGLSGMAAASPALAQATAAAVAWVEGAVVLPDDDYDDLLTLATVMLAARWVKRADSPGGVQSMGADGFAVRVTKVDPDIETMLAPYVPHLGFA